MEIIEQAYDWKYDPGRRTATTHIVLHHAAADGDVQGIHNYHLSLGWAGIAYHFYVRKDGRIYRGRPGSWNGGHTSGYNRVAVGVCFEGNFDTETMGEAQIRAGRELVERLQKTYPSAAVVRHRDLNGTACPGKNFPFAEILAGENTDADDGPSAWAKDACAWAVDNGIFTGDADGKFRWKDTITRQEVAALLYRLHK